MSKYRQKVRPATEPQIRRPMEPARPGPGRRGTRFMLVARRLARHRLPRA